MRLSAILLGCLTFATATLSVADPLPEGAKLRLGSSKFRHPGAKIALSADGKQLISFSVEMKSVRVWEATTGKLLRELSIDATGYLGAIAWAPDGKTFVTSESNPGNKEKVEEYFLRIRDAESGKVIRSISYERGNYGGRTPIRYLGNGKEIACQTASGIGIWELETGTELIHNKFTNAGYSDFGVSGDGKRIALVGPDWSGEVYVWDWESGKEPRTLKTDLKIMFRSVVVSRDGKQFALLDDLVGSIRLIDANDGKLLGELRLPDRNRRFSNAAFSPDDKKLLAPDGGGRDYGQYDEPGGLIIWDVATGKLERRLTVASGAADVVISANGKFVAASAFGYPIWELATGKQLNPLPETDLAISQRAFAHRGFILTLADNQPARLWDEKSGRLLNTFKHNNKWTRAGAISPDGARVATSANDDLIKVWDAATGKLIHSLIGHGDMNGTSALRFSADGRKLVSFGADFYLRVTDLAYGKAIREFAIRPTGLKVPEKDSSGRPDEMMSIIAAGSATLSSDGSWLCISGGDKYCLFNSDTGKEALTLALQPGLSENPAFSPDGSQLLTVGRGKQIQTPIKGGGTRYEAATENPLACWDSKTGKKIWEVNAAGHIGHMAFSPDGRTFALCKYGWDKTAPVEFRDAATGKLLGQLHKLPMSSRDVAFTPDGNRVVLVMHDHTVLVYDLPELKTQK